MLRLIALLLAVLPLTARADYVNSIASESSTPGVTSFNSSSLGSLVNGNVVVVWVTYYATAQRTIGVTGAGVASWTRDAEASIYSAGDTWGVEVFYGVANGSSTAPVVSVSSPGTAGYIGVVTMQYDDYSSWIDAVTARQASPGTGTNAISSGNVNVTSQPARQVGIVFNYTAATPPTAGTGYTTEATEFTGYVRVASRQQTSTGNSAATFTAAGGQGGSTYYTTQVVFAESGGGSPATLSSPTPSGTLGTQTTATIGATTTDSTGTTFYAVVDTAGNISGITEAEIIAGQENDGMAAVAACNAAVSTSSPSCGVTGLTANTAYSYAAVQSNGNGNSNVVTGTFTTASAPSVVISPLFGGGGSAARAVNAH